MDSSWVAAVAGLVGALIGAGTALGGEVLRARRVLRADVLRAARAWRDDFYSFQTQLGLKVQDGLTIADDSWLALGTKDDVLSLSRGLGGDGWSLVADARRRLETARRDQCVGYDLTALSRMFWYFQTAREYLASEDRDSYGGVHKFSQHFEPRPKDLHLPRPQATRRRTR